MTGVNHKQEREARRATPWLRAVARLIERLTIIALYAFLLLLFASKLVFRDRESVTDRLDRLLNVIFPVFLLLGSFTGAVKSVKEYRSRSEKGPAATAACIVWLGAYSLAFGCYLVARGEVVW
jgi:hypothetical protein